MFLIVVIVIASVIIARLKGPQPDGFDAVRRTATAHFMHKFVAALSDLPDNAQPALDYEPLLRDAAAPVRCVDCHEQSPPDPGSKVAAPFRRKREFVERLMENWVRRLNSRQRAKLRKRVRCTDCHAIDPRDTEELERVYPSLMHAFMRALTEPPKSANPSTTWKPLLKAGVDVGEVSCAACHDEEMAERTFDLTRPADYADDKRFMIPLMERWTERLNMKAGDLLRKAVVCRDCHEQDPRR